MAEYLLKGWKMLSKACKSCNSPLFEYKGEIRCVVCDETMKPAAVPEEEDVRPIPSQPDRTYEEAPEAHIAERQLALEIEQTLVYLCERIRTEPHAGDCLVLVKALREGVEALSSVTGRSGGRYPR
ncbi:hypothetical protein ASZ90_009079 [hydrocarbon metagenome]|uniref:Sjogrens syndrome scleroderma autoantigen 1 n=1 Tax=hydrocarbon metagenome TaxID=938273 RepID=A0A0W8FJT0_9ZZZZ